jgi:hypothetical protein
VSGSVVVDVAVSDGNIVLLVRHGSVASVSTQRARPDRLERVPRHRYPRPMVIAGQAGVLHEADAEYSV